MSLVINVVNNCKENRPKNKLIMTDIKLTCSLQQIVCYSDKLYHKLGKMFLIPRQESNAQPSDLWGDALTIKLTGLIHLFLETENKINLA